jgi:hypothetical protein
MHSVRVLCCVVLCCSCTVLYCIVLYCVVSYCVVVVLLVTVNSVKTLCRTATSYVTEYSETNVMYLFSVY